MSVGWTKRRILITVRTYPTPATKAIESSCTAGITEDGEWIRLFPIPYRLMDQDRRFSKYQWIDVDVKKASDSRPESFHPDLDSITIVRLVPPTRHWAERRAIVMPIKAHCMCCLQTERNEQGHPTLGLFKPREIRELIIENDRADWTQAEEKKLRQMVLGDRRRPAQLEKIPYKFSYRYVCDEPACKGHKQMCTDWEMAELYRRCRSRYGARWEIKFREKYETAMIELNDTHFYVGTLSTHPHRWIIVGLWYPRKVTGATVVETRQLEMFADS